MALEHMVWLTPKAGVSEDKMEDILASIRALTHCPVCWRFQRDATLPIVRTGPPMACSLRLTRQRICRVT